VNEKIKEKGEIFSDPRYELVSSGSLIVLYHDGRAFYLTDYLPRKRFSTHLGAVDLPEPLYYGMVLKSTKGVEFAVLKPSHSELLTMLKRQTTVVYPKDAGFILLELGVREGGKYGEVGAGSGAFTAVLAQMVGEKGRVYSLDIHPGHLKQAEENLRKLNLLSRVELFLRDGEKEGFPVLGLDGVFIDLPEPWRIVPSATRALKGGGFWVSLSPTLEQAIRTEIALEGEGYVKRRVVETYIREWRAYPGRTRPYERMIGHTAFLVLGRKTFSTPPLS
jgi:tRNA (adenine57-N1/adenine58-N1)-methyltransferase